MISHHPESPESSQRQELTRFTAAAVTVVAAARRLRGRLVLGLGTGAVALAGGTGLARAAVTGNGVLGGSLFAVALERGLVAARAGGLLGCWRGRSES